MPTIKLKVTINGAEFAYEGEADVAALLPPLEQWLNLQDQTAAVKHLMEQLKKSNDSLAGTVQAHQPSPS